MKRLIEAMRARRRFLLSTVAPLVLIAGLVLVPKDPAYAAPGRLAMTMATLAASVWAMIGITLTWRRYRDAVLQARFAKGTRPIRDTVQFLLHERRLSRRYRLAFLVGLIISTATWVLSHWPQLSALAGWHSPSLGLAGVFLLLFVAQPLHARRSLVNAVYLKRYLRQQAAHVGFKPPRRAQRTAQPEPPVTLTGPLSFRAGGFEWRFDDLTKNAAVIGQSGSGKTVCVLNSTLEGLLGCHADGQKTAGVIFDPKGVYHDILPALTTRLGRNNDLVILSPRDWERAKRTPAAIAWNPLDTDDDALEVAARIITVMKLAGGVQARDSFFLDAARGFLRHALVLARAANAPDPVTLLQLHRLCAEPVEEPHIYNDLIATLTRKYPGLPPEEIETAVGYFEQEWRSLPDRHRSGVRSSVTQLIDDFTTAPIAEMISGRSTVSIPDLLEQGKVLYVHLPLAERERVSRILCGLIKLELQREVLRRPRKTRPSFMFADEFQTLFVAGEQHGDSDFFERSRESNHANIVAAQNLSSFLKKTPNRAEVTNFLGLCATKILLRNDEAETNEWASKLFGERSEIIVSASEAARLDGGWSRHQTSYSRSTRSVRVVPPDSFARLAVPMQDDPARQHAESIVHLGSRAATEMLELAWPVHPLLP